MSSTTFAKTNLRVKTRLLKSLQLRVKHDQIALEQAKLNCCDESLLESCHGNFPLDIVVGILTGDHKGTVEFHSKRRNWTTIAILVWNSDEQCVSISGAIQARQFHDLHVGSTKAIDVFRGLGNRLLRVVKFIVDCSICLQAASKAATKAEPSSKTNNGVSDSKQQPLQFSWNS